jgi:asparagine synthase (glutamine-hydrolysing)
MTGLYVQCTDGRMGTLDSYQAVKTMMTSAYLVKDSKGCIAGNSHVALGTISHYENNGALPSVGVCQDSANNISAALGAYWFDLGAKDIVSKSDLLASFMKGITKIYGNYAFAIWNQSRSELICETEKTGVFPLYYYQSLGTITISTELKSLLTLNIDHGGLDKEAIGEYLSLGHIASTKTLFKNIKRLPAGYRLIWCNGRLDLQQQWFYRFPRNKQLDDEFLEKIYSSLDLALSRYRNVYDKFSLSLSGGLDSRILAGLAKKKNIDFEVITMGPKGSLECEVAKKIADILEIPSHKHEFSGEHFPSWVEKAVYLSEGRCPPSHIHYFDGMISGHYVDAPHIHGMAGGPVLGGDYCSSIPENGLSPAVIFKKCLDITQSSKIYWNISPELIFQSELAAAFVQSPERVTAELFDLFDDMNNGGGSESYRFIFRNNPLLGACLSAQVLPWMDVIYPFADANLITVESQLQFDDISERKLQYNLANKYLADITKVPRIKDGYLVSMDKYDIHEYDRVRNKHKFLYKINYYLCRLSFGRLELNYNNGFPFYNTWYRKYPSIRSLFQNVLLSEESLSRGLWLESGIIKLMNDLRVGRNIWGSLAGILFIELFLQQVLDGKHKPSRGAALVFTEPEVV